jgi:hypothetical protein
VRVATLASRAGRPCSPYGVCVARERAIESDDLCGRDPRRMLPDPDLSTELGSGPFGGNGRSGSGLFGGWLSRWIGVEVESSFGPTFSNQHSTEYSNETASRRELFWSGQVRMR